MVLEEIKKSGGLEYTREVLEALHGKLERELGRLEGEFGMKNSGLRMSAEMLKVAMEPKRDGVRGQ